MRICPKCALHLPADTRTCIHCGMSVAVEDVAAEGTPSKTERTFSVDAHLSKVEHHAERQSGKLLEKRLFKIGLFLGLLLVAAWLFYHVNAWLSGESATTEEVIYTLGIAGFGGIVAIVLGVIFAQVGVIINNFGGKEEPGERRNERM